MLGVRCCEGDRHEVERDVEKCASMGVGTDCVG